MKPGDQVLILNKESAEVLELYKDRALIQLESGTVMWVDPEHLIVMKEDVVEPLTADIAQPAVADKKN